jgi:hypothetical protein
VTGNQPGMTVREIQGFLAEQYGGEVSPGLISTPPLVELPRTAPLATTTGDDAQATLP